MGRMACGRKQMTHIWYNFSRNLSLIIMMWLLHLHRNYIRKIREVGRNLFMGVNHSFKKWSAKTELYRHKDKGFTATAFYFLIWLISKHIESNGNMEICTVDKECVIYVKALALTDTMSEFIVFTLRTYVSFQLRWKCEEWRPYKRV